MVEHILNFLLFDNAFLIVDMSVLLDVFKSFGINLKVNSFTLSLIEGKPASARMHLIGEVGKAWMLRRIAA